MSAVVARHPTDTRWVSFERRGGGWEPFSVVVGDLRSTISGSMQGLTGTFSFSERDAVSVRAMLAHEPQDLTRPELRDVSMTVLCPTEAGSDLWCLLRAVRGAVIYGGRESHFRHPPNLGQEILRLFTQLGWENLEARVRPEFPREILVRPQFVASAIVPSAFLNAEEQRRRSERERVQAAYEAKLKSRDPRVKRAEQWALDQACLKGTAEQKAAAARERKRIYGFGQSVRITPQVRPQATEDNTSKPHVDPGHAWFSGDEGAQ